MSILFLQRVALEARATVQQGVKETTWYVTRIVIFVCVKQDILLIVKESASEVHILLQTQFLAHIKPMNT